MPASAAAILAKDTAALPEAPRRYRMSGGIAASIGLHLLILLLIADSFLRPPPAPPDLALPVTLIRLGAGSGGEPAAPDHAATPGPAPSIAAQIAGESRPPVEAPQQPAPASPAASPTPPAQAAAPPAQTAAQHALASAMTRPRDTAPARNLDLKAKTGRPLDNRRAAPADPLAARLQQLARLKSTTMPQPPAANGARSAEATAAGIGAAAGGAPSSQASASVRDFLRAQVIRHWNLRTEPSRNADWTVSIHLQLRRDGSVVLAEIVDPARFRHNRPYFEFALSARNAVLLAAPLEIPAGQYELVSDIVLPFSARDVLQ